MSFAKVEIEIISTPVDGQNVAVQIDADSIETLAIQLLME